MLLEKFRKQNIKTYLEQTKAKLEEKKKKYKNEITIDSSASEFGSRMSSVLAAGEVGTGVTVTGIGTAVPDVTGVDKPGTTGTGAIWGMGAWCIVTGT